jgi:hypothetical protein
MAIALAVFFLAAAAGPKLLGEAYAVEMFVQTGAADPLRYLVGVLELAGAIGLLVPRLAGLAALGLVGVMIGAVLTQVLSWAPGNGTDPGRPGRRARLRRPRAVGTVPLRPDELSAGARPVPVAPELADLVTTLQVAEGRRQSCNRAASPQSGEPAAVRHISAAARQPPVAQ